MKSHCNVARRRKSQGFSLLEMILAVVIISTVAAVSLQFIRPTGTVARQRACDVTRQLLQNEAERYFSEQGIWPSRRLSELSSARFTGNPIPPCPCGGGSYEMSGGIVICPVHEPTRR